MIPCKSKKTLFSYFIKYLALFVFFLLASLAISGCNNKTIYSDSEKLNQALRERGINISEDIGYHDLVELLRGMSVVVPAKYGNDTMTYLDTNADSLIQLPTSKPGILSWHFEKIFFIDKDLVFASFSDGEMYGGDLLVEISRSEDQIKSMRALWNNNK
jgi:hypothetical protein